MDACADTHALRAPPPPLLEMPARDRQESEPVRPAALLAVSAGVLLSGSLAGGWYARRKERSFADDDWPAASDVRRLWVWKWFVPSAFPVRDASGGSDYYERMRLEYQRANSAPGAPPPPSPSTAGGNACVRGAPAPAAVLLRPRGGAAVAAAKPASGASAKKVRPVVMGFQALAIATTGWAVVATAAVWGVRKALGVNTVREFNSWMSSNFRREDLNPLGALTEEDDALLRAVENYLGISADAEL